MTAGPSPATADGGTGWPTTTGVDGAGWRAAATGGAAVAAVVHVAAAFDHADHGGRYVAFFCVAATAQLILALRLRARPSSLDVLAGMVGTVALVGAYVAQQLVALPLTGGHIEAGAGRLGLVALLAELVTVASLPALVEGRWRSSSVNIALAGGVALWALWFSGIGGVGG